MVGDPLEDKIPVLLLKTKSVPSDGYEDYLTSVRGYASFEPKFVPVFEHRLLENGIDYFRRQLRHGRTDSEPHVMHGGLIFTSQRAVEAFRQVVEESRSDEHWPHLQGVPIYAVGPATVKALRSISKTPPLQIYGEECGNGESLATFILDHYSQWYGDCGVLPALMFLVGEQRRDIIPKILMDPKLDASRRIQVDELVVYGTSVMESFEQDFKRELEQTRCSMMRWIVVFSPTGCEAMLRALGMIKEVINDSEVEKGTITDKRTYVATIGPTTRDHLKQRFAFDPDVCAEKPTPEGVEHGIKTFILNNA